MCLPAQRAYTKGYTIETIEERSNRVRALLADRKPVLAQSTARMRYSARISSYGSRNGLTSCRASTSKARDGRQLRLHST